MPFSRYQIRNEFSLADPELYKAADKDDPEALLEGVAMAGLVGVLRQLGDLAEFAAEIFHGLHEEVMATAARGHGLLTRVQQVESDLPLIERAFLSQTGHSAFFSSSGINWHPNLQTEQNLITKGDLPRFVMDSYEECRGPPRLFLLDKFDVAGAGACLKRYTDPSFYKVEVSSFEMMSAEAQRDKKIRKIKKKGSRVKNGDTPESLQSSHVKLHQLLLEERVQTGASEPARRVKIKKRDIKFPFDTETGKGYMETLLSSPPEDKLVHEVKMVNSTLPEEPELETLEDKMVNSTLDDIEEKHISVVEENKEDGVEDAYQSDDVASETDNYMDALATMESEVETDVEFRAANSDPSIKQETLSDWNLEKIQASQVLNSQSAPDDESSPMKGKITNFSYSDSDSASTSANNTSPRVNSPHAFASKEIPFRPRALPAQATDNEDLFMDQETTFKESNIKESDVSDVNIPTRKGEIEIDPEDVIASVTSEDDISNSTLENSHVEEQSFGQKRDQLVICEDGVVKSESGLAEARASFSNEDETELKDKERVSVDSESQSANVAVCDNDSKDGDNNSFISENEKELDERIPESFSSETKDSIPVTDDTVEKDYVERESVEESGTSREIDSIPSESTELVESDETKEPSEESDHLNGQILRDVCNGNENDVNPDTESLESGEMMESSVESDSIPSNHKNWVENDASYPEKESVESCEKKESSEEPVISLESDSVPSAYHGIDNNGNECDDGQLEKESIESGEKKESSEEPIVSLESDSIPPAYHDRSNIQSLDSLHNKNENDIVNDNPSMKPNESVEKKESSEESVIVPESDSNEKTDQNGFQDVSPIVDLQEYGPDLTESAEAQESNSLSVDQNGEINKLEVEPPIVDLLLPELAPINMEEMPPLPPLPPMQWRMGRSQNPYMMSIPGGAQADISHFSPAFPLIQTHPSSKQNEISRNEKFVEEVVPQPSIIEESPKDSIIEESKKDPISIIRLPSTSSLPSGDDEMPNGIRPMKVQRPRTPLIDAVAAHDKNKLRKVSERAVPLFPKEEEKDTFLEQIRAKSFNLKPAAPTRPIIQGPTTNLRVAAILEKANAIRQAFAGSDDDEDGSDSWSE